MKIVFSTHLDSLSTENQTQCLHAFDESNKRLLKIPLQYLQLILLVH
jgi:hypothetical protein